MRWPLAAVGACHLKPWELGAEFFHGVTDNRTLEINDTVAFYFVSIVLLCTYYVCGAHVGSCSGLALKVRQFPRVIYPLNNFFISVQLVVIISIVAWR